MEKYKVELKKIDYNERMSQETSCFIANLYINGKLVGECTNDGWGGCTNYYGNSKENNQLLNEVNKYFKSLPHRKSKIIDEILIQPTLEEIIDEIFFEWLKKRELKKMYKLMESAIVVGKKTDESHYFYFKQIHKLSNFPKPILQKLVHIIKEKHCKDDFVILNNNLGELGIVY